MITHDRWQRIKEIFQSAQVMPATERLDFLNQACGDDKSIREEVEALLTADDSNEDDDFLSTPAYEFAAGMLSDENARPSEFEAGQKVGRYTILCPLGAGGMGQIYLAQDDRLGRKIALKMIAREFATDERRVLRFEQEARAASVLNHPNVCVIHEIGVTENQRHFIAMEHIQGITLRDKLRRDPVTTLEAIHIARQVADALAAAHAAGIVHRDIKPENIMLRPDGYVKVLDFGLAKLTEMMIPEPILDGQSAHQLSTGVRTEAGTLMGTVKYMSPEQLRETELDERTDIWSLGVVLYEMLTRTTPFEGKTPRDTIALILGPQPPALSLPDELPARLRQIVKKAMEKDRALRYQTVTKLASDLKSLHRELEREPQYGAISPEPPLPWQQTDALETRTLPSRTTAFTRLKSQALLTADTLFMEIRTHKAASLFAGVTVVLAALLSIPALIQQFKPSQDATALDMRFLTNSGTSTAAAITKDGKFVAHVEEQAGKQSLLLTSTDNSETSQLVEPDNVLYLGLTFSPDNLDLYFTREDKDGSHSVYKMRTHGGAPAKVKERVDSPISFSPQANQFAFVRFDQTKNEHLLIVCDANGANERVIATRKDRETFSTFGLAWAPDGSKIVCPAGRWDQGYHTDLLAFDLKDNSAHLIDSQSWFHIYEVAWRDDLSALVINARERETTPFQLWRVSYPGGEVKRITSDLNEYMSVSLAGDKIVAVRQDRSWKLWVADVADLNSAKPIVSGTGFGYGVTWAGDGNIVYSSMIQDHLNLSRIAADGSNNVQLTDLGDNYNPAASSDGRYVVFSSKQPSGFNIWRMNASDGSELQQLTFTDGNFYPAVSPDNQWVSFDSLNTTQAAVWKVPLQGGTPVLVAAGYRMPAFSRDDQWIAVRYDQINSISQDLLIYHASGGDPVRSLKIPRMEWQRVYWLDGPNLSYLKNVNGASNIWTYNLDSGVEKQLTNFNSEQIFSYAWSTDLKRLAYQRGGRISNVTIISSER